MGTEEIGKIACQGRLSQYVFGDVDPFGADQAVPPALREPLAARLVEARAMYPGVSLSDSEFFLHVLEKLETLMAAMAK